MKNLLLLLFAILFTFSAAQAAPKPGQLILEWDDPDNTPESVTAYGLWESITSPNPTPGGPPIVESVLLATLQPVRVVPDPVPGVASYTHSLENVTGTHTYFVTAVSAQGLHSLGSNTVTVNMLRPPRGNRVKLTLMSGDKVGNMKEVAVYEDEMTDDRKFWQMLIAKD